MSDRHGAGRVAGNSATKGLGARASTGVSRRPGRAGGGGGGRLRGRRHGTALALVTRCWRSRSRACKHLEMPSGYAIDLGHSWRGTWPSSSAIETVCLWRSPPAPGFLSVASARARPPMPAHRIHGCGALQEFAYQSISVPPTAKLFK